MHEEGREERRAIHESIYIMKTHKIYLKKKASVGEEDSHEDSTA